jgi:hypothetical protein
MQFDYVIVGSGAVGSTLANQLSKSNRVALVDIGSKPKGKQRRLLAAPFIESVSKDFSHGFSGIFGGLTEFWKGKTYLITEKECKKWPIEYEEFLENSNNLALEMGISHENIHFQERIDNKAFYHRSIRLGRINLYEYFRISENGNIFCFEESTIYDFEFDKISKKINDIYLIKASGKKTLIKVNKAVILCSGGLGNLPLYKKLLEKIFPNEFIFNSFRISEQPHISIGKIKKNSNLRIGKHLNSSKNNFATEDCIVIQGKDENYALQITDINIGSKFISRFETRFRDQKIQNIIVFLVRNFLRIQNKILKFLFNLKNNFNSNIGSLELWFEDKERNNSRAQISQKKWFHKSLSKLDINYNFSNKNYKILKSELEKYTNGEIFDFKKRELNSNNIYVGPKAGCSTPMKSSPLKGDVNKHLQITGVENLYILGLNIFPAIGYTNPTWTLMVLAKRLAKHLHSKYDS